MRSGAVSEVPNNAIDRSTIAALPLSAPGAEARTVVRRPQDFRHFVPRTIMYCSTVQSLIYRFDKLQMSIAGL
jgi:hypothetical protein